MDSQSSNHSMEPALVRAHNLEKLAESLDATVTGHKLDNDKDAFLVDWDGPDDAANPLNWSTARKHCVTLTLSVSVIVVTFASSVFSSASNAVAKQFDVSSEVGKLRVTLILCGYAIGPLVWGPLSEHQGRKPPMLISYLSFVLFSLATATAKDLQTILICRFFGGLFGCGPLSIAGGAQEAEGE
ncbi:hypothetical protein EX895_005151 [Sporisorium graminicola]|uniref:Major facilitator superfamily (MFS) profile domain-containing protein n=1 Tax=Sporisorium graminicola TaxID=280036 RepID=A0A4U7KQQ6_9BASI|nr:hypothetical protein EX895_005151 [Sporisorium graminicola]TKY86326.1 hypothetical protein EX895_005151 [Sporisorium graminicola]